MKPQKDYIVFESNYVNLFTFKKVINLEKIMNQTISHVKLKDDQIVRKIFL